MRNYIKQIWVIILGIIFMFNVLLFLSVIYNPFYNLLSRPEFSEMNEPIRNIISGSLTIIYIALVNTCLIILLVLKKSNKTKFFISSTMTLFAFGLIYMPTILYPYPDTIEEYVENGYQIRVEGWYNDADSAAIEKLYRSEKPIDYYKDLNKIKWLQDKKLSK